ncbi:hypothetical protein ADK55_20530 [Streptomyces sp. WM4235]|nr:hypothetical protein ADK55_20530 [Streptomyces sp. WM4235]
MDDPPGRGDPRPADRRPRRLPRRRQRRAARRPRPRRDRLAPLQGRRRQLHPDPAGGTRQAGGSRTRCGPVADGRLVHHRVPGPARRR